MASSPILCDICREDGDTTNAEFRCIDCAKFLCKFCERAHRRFGETKSHQVYLLTGDPEKDRDRARKESKLRDIKCLKHPEEDLSLFCIDDQTVVCNVGARKDHPGHNIVDIEEEAKDEITNLRLLKGLAIQRKALLDENLEDSNEALKLYKRKTNALLDAINADYDAKRRELEKHFDMLREDAKVKTKAEMEKKNAKQHVIQGNIDITEDTKQAAIELIEHGHPVDIMRASPGTAKKLKDWKKLPEKDTIEMRTFTYEPGTLDLTHVGRVKRDLRDLRNPTVEKRTNVGLNITGGSIGHGNNIVICNSSNIFTYDADSFVRQKTSTANGTFYDVCCIPGNLYAATDSKNKSIAIFDEELKRVKSIGNFQIPHGISSAPNDRLLVTDKGDKCVYLVDSDTGAKISTIGKGKFDHPEDAVITSNNIVVISDYNKGFVKGFTLQDVEVFSYGSYGTGKGQLRNPWGMAIDSNDYILVSDYSNNRTHIIDEDGKFIKYLTVSGQANNPNCIMLDHQDNAVIGRNSELVRVKYLE